MRKSLRFVLLFAVATGGLRPPLSPAEEPLLKPVAPPGTGARVRFTVETDNKYTGSQLKARVPKAKAKGGDMTDATVAFDTLPGRGAVTSKKWKSWGYDVPANKVGVLPEVVLPGAQLVPKPTKGRDVEVRFAAITLDIVDPPGDSDLVYGCDLYLRLSDLTKHADRTFEPRLYFGDKFLELTCPRGAVKRLETGDGTPPEPAVSTDEKLVPVAGAMTVRTAPVFAFASVNGLPQYKLPDGKMQTVDVAVSSNTTWEGGILMTLGTARGCGVEIDDGKAATGVGAGFETMIARGKVKEFRLGFRTGAGFKDQQDLVLKDVTVYIDKIHSGHFVWLGSKFVADHLTDAVYACGSDGAWKLLGRAKPEMLQDIKTRTPAKK